MLSLFSQPYPATNGFLPSLRKAAIVGVFVGLFLLVFQPFGLDTWATTNKLLKIMGFGAVTFVITAIHFPLWPALFPHQFSEERWTVGHEILFITANVLLIAIANRFYLQTIAGLADGSSFSWMGMILVTFLVGAFPVTGLVLLSYIRRLKKYNQLAGELPVNTSAAGNSS